MTSILVRNWLHFGRILRGLGFDAGPARMLPFLSSLSVITMTRADDLPAFHESRRELYPRLFPDGVYPPNTLLVIDRLVLPELLLEIEAVAAV